MMRVLLVEMLIVWGDIGRQPGGAAQVGVGDLRDKDGSWDQVAARAVSSGKPFSRIIFQNVLCLEVWGRTFQ